MDIWFEVYSPKHSTHCCRSTTTFGQNEVDVGDQKGKVTKKFGDKTVVATDSKAATWTGQPPVVRYLFIDAALPLKKITRMSRWASPDGDKAHDSEVSDMIGSWKLQEE